MKSGHYLLGCLICLVIGFALGVLIAYDSGHKCVIESDRRISPRIDVFSEDGINWDTTFTYHEP